MPTNVFSNKRRKRRFDDIVQHRFDEHREEKIFVALQNLNRKLDEQAECIKQMKNGIDAIKQSFLKTKHVTEKLLEPASTDKQLEKIIDSVQVRCNCQR